MATADTEELLSKKDWGHILFSKQFCKELTKHVVKIDDVVLKFIASKTISEAESKSLRAEIVKDRKFGHLLTIITAHCNRNDLQALKTFIDILRDTNNVAVAQQLSVIYKERVDYVAILRRLLEEKALVRDMENEISHLQRNLEEKDRYCKSLTDENNKLVDQDETFRKEKVSLEKQIKIKDEELLVVGKEMGELTRIKNDLENEVNLKSNVIRKRDKEIVEKEKEVWDAVDESNGLRLKIDRLQQQLNKAMVEDREELSKEIEILKDEIAEKENTIMDHRKYKTIIRKEIEEEFRNIIKGQDKKLDAQMAMIKQQNEKVDHQTAMIKQQNEKFDDQTAMIKQQNEKFDDQMAMIKQQNEKFDDQMAMIKQQNEKIDVLIKAQMVSPKQQNEKIDALAKAQKALAKQNTENFGMIISALNIHQKKK